MPITYPSEIPATYATPTVRVHHLPATSPLVWLRLACRDIQRAPYASLFYGLMFALMGWVLHTSCPHSPQLLTSLTTAFVLLGPLLAIGLYDISRQLAQTGSLHFAASLTAWRKNIGALSFYSLFLLITVSSWVLISTMLFSLLFIPDKAPVVTLFDSMLLFAGDLNFAMTYFLCGVLFAAVVFICSVVSVPMMLEKNCDMVIAVLVSIKAVLTNPAAMLIWAGIIALLIFIGLITGYIGLIIITPVIGHASWHAYCSLVDWTTQD